MARMLVWTYVAKCTCVCVSPNHMTVSTRRTRPVEAEGTNATMRMFTRLHTRFLPIIPIVLLTTLLSRAVWFDFNVTLTLHLMHALFHSPPLCPFFLSAHPFFLHSLPPVSSPAGRQHVNYSPQMQIFPCARQDLQWRQNFPSFKLL